VYDLDTDEMPKTGGHSLFRGLHGVQRAKTERRTRPKKGF
jgi:hypothetical protein